MTTETGGYRDEGAAQTGGYRDERGRKPEASVTTPPPGVSDYEYKPPWTGTQSDSIDGGCAARLLQITISVCDFLRGDVGRAPRALRV